MYQCVAGELEDPGMIELMELCCYRFSMGEITETAWPGEVRSICTQIVEYYKVFFTMYTILKT